MEEMKFFFTEVSEIESFFDVIAMQALAEKEERLEHGDKPEFTGMLLTLKSQVQSLSGGVQAPAGMNPAKLTILLRQIASEAVLALSSQALLMDSEEFCAFLLAKHKAYTATPLLEWKYLGLAMRMTSKIDRSLALANNGGTTMNSESIRDNLTDIVGYCVLGLRMAELGI